MSGHQPRTRIDAEQPSLPEQTPERGQTAGDSVMIRSEEQLRTGVANVVVGRARLVTSVVTEEQTFTIRVRHQEVHLVHDPLPLHGQGLSDRGPAEEIYEVIRHAEQVQFTTQVVPVERVRLVKRVVDATGTITEHVRSERIDTDPTPIATSTASTRSAETFPG